MSSIILSILLTIYAYFCAGQTLYQTSLLFGMFFLTAIGINLFFRAYPAEKFNLKEEDYKLVAKERIFSIDELSTRSKKVYIKEEKCFGIDCFAVCTEIDDRGVQEVTLNFDKKHVEFLETEGDPHYELYLARKLIFGNIWQSVIPCRYANIRAKIFLPKLRATKK